MSKGYTGPPQSSGGGGGTVVVVVLIIGAVLGLGCLGVCGMAFLGFSWTTTPMGPPPVATTGTVSVEEAFGQAILVATASDMITNDARVKEALGDPITVEPGGEQADAQTGGTASFDLPLRGPKGTATGHVSGQRIASGWGVSSVKVTLADGSTIDINHTGTTADAPAEGEAAPAADPDNAGAPAADSAEAAP